MGKSKHSSLEMLLRRRVREIRGSSTVSINELVDQLRAKYPEYSRQKPQRFTRMVKQTLDSDNNKGKRKLIRNDEDVITSLKKAKKIDIREQSESSSEDRKEDVSAVTVTTSSNEDEDEVDLTKSMLRNKYKNVELESVTDRVTDRKKVDSHSLMEDSNSVKPGTRFNDLPGLDAVLDELKNQFLIPLLEPDLLPILGVSPIGGILLHGPPGCGKTRLAHAIANETGLPFYSITATELVSGISGSSEENIRELFSKAFRTAPSIIFIDEIDAIASNRENLQREMEKRIVTQLMTCMDSGDKPGNVLVIGATNRPHALDPALRRPGRFDREIALGVPDVNARVKIISALTRNVKLEGDLDPLKIARLTPGFVGADLKALVNKAGYLALERTIGGRNLESTDTQGSWRKPWTREEKDNLSITISDFERAAKLIQPSTKREGFASKPNVKWENLGGVDFIRAEFKYLVRSIKYPVEYEACGLRSEMGFLLYGPPGCGKTLIAKAVANEVEANFMYIRGSEMMNKYVGESELAVRTMFSRARACAPCILFFDEIDALAPKRGSEGSWVTDRLVNQLLIELDGGDERKGVYVIAATNRPEVIDEALLRPGRLGKHLNVSLPNPDQRGLILKALCRNKKLGAGVDLMAIGRSEACENFSGADLSDLINRALAAASEEKFRKIEAAAREGTRDSSSFIPPAIEVVHLEEALMWKARDKKRESIMMKLQRA